jgi:hypothetical protein
VGRDRGVHGIVVLGDGTRTSPEKLNRPELANFGGWHAENRSLVFRIDLPDGYEIIVEHDVAKNALRRVRVNGVDVAERWSFEHRRQKVSRGRFGVRSAIHNTNPLVNLQQFYWYYRVEQLG